MIRTGKYWYNVLLVIFFTNNRNKIKPFVRYSIFDSSESAVDKCVLFGLFSYIVNPLLSVFYSNVLSHKYSIVYHFIEIQVDHG